jgi:hypothetical protein
MDRYTYDGYQAHRVLQVFQEATARAREPGGCWVDFNRFSDRDLQLLVYISRPRLRSVLAPAAERKGRRKVRRECRALLAERANR